MSLKRKIFQRGRGVNGLSGERSSSAEGLLLVEQVEPFEQPTEHAPEAVLVSPLREVQGVAVGDEEGADLDGLVRAQVVNSVEDVGYFFVAQFGLIQLSQIRSAGHPGRSRGGAAR